ncbi:MAG: helix-turn-helix transcriptional regulator [Alphaproteobacteria bacterium]|nr:helix-turn-helix transcriptional regulator [Alphaproteobacteria bacterium]
MARNLRKLRVREKLSQEALAVDAGIDRTYVSRLERGLENPTVSVLSRLAKALNAKIDEFFSPTVLNEPRPQPLPSGRRPKKGSSKK